MWSMLLLTPLLAAPRAVLQLPFDGDLRDSAGLGHDAFLAEAAFADGHAGQGLRLAGRTATVSDAAELRLAPGLRIEGWVRFESSPAGTFIATKEREYMLRVDSAGEGGQFSFFVFLHGWEPRVRSTVVPRPGEWYHWVAAWDGDEITLEVNGERAGLPRAGRPTTAGAPLEFGPFDGVLDEVSLTNPAAGESGVAHWPFDDDLRDTTGRGHDLTAPAASFVDGRVGRAVELGRALSVPDHEDLRLAAGLRIDCTVRFDELPTGYGYLAMKDGEYQLRVDSQAEGGRFSFFVNLDGWEPRVQSTVRAEVGVWYRLSARWDGQALTLEVNGQRSRTLRSGLPRPGDRPLVLGPLAARLDDLRIENPRLPVLRLSALHQDETLLLAGRPERLSGMVENLGSPTEAATATLLAGPGVTCLSPLEIPLGELAAGESKPVEWTVQAAESVSSGVLVQLAAGDHRPPPYVRILAFLASDQPDPPRPAGLDNPAATWYIDGLAGDNARAGTSPETAWRDFAPVNGRTLGPGERLLLRRGSVFDQELQLGAAATADRWAELGAYGEGARPILRRNWDIGERCALVRDPDHLLIRGLVFAYAGKGLVVQYTAAGHAGLVIEDCLAHHIEGLYRPNAHGIPEWRDRGGAPGDSLNSSAGIAVIGAAPKDVLIRDCEMFQCSWGYFVQGDNVTVDRVYCHDNHAHNTSPHPALVAVRRSFLINSLFDASGWHASAGTMGIMLVGIEGLVIRNCTFRNQPDSGSHDEGGIDFENSGNGCLIDRCTFEHNAGAAIEVLGLQTPQPRNLEITGSRFIENNLANKLGPAEIFIWGRSTSPDVCCSTGEIWGNGYVTVPGVEFYLNEAPELTAWTLRDNTRYDSREALRRAMPLNDPPAADAGPDRYSDTAAVRLAGRVTDEGAVTVRWEVLEGPGPVRFDPPDAAETSAELPLPGDYLLRLVADDGELWHSDLVAVHRLPAGSSTAAAWEFNTPLDKEGWSEADLGTVARDWPDQQWPTHSEPVQHVAGGFYLVAVEESAGAHLLSPDEVGLELATAPSLRLRMMNHTPATQMRLSFVTEADPTWSAAKSIAFEVTPNDPAPRVYDLDLSGLGTWTGRLKRLRLELATGEPLTGTVRIDYLWLGRLAGR